MLIKFKVHLVLFGAKTKVIKGHLLHICIGVSLFNYSVELSHGKGFWFCNCYCFLFFLESLYNMGFVGPGLIYIILILLSIKRRVLLPMSLWNWSLKALALARAFLMVIRKCQKLLRSTLKWTFPMTAAPKLKLRSEIILAHAIFYWSLVSS